MAGAVDVSVLIVSYNTRQETLNCLASVFEQTQGMQFEVILVDNASEDGSTEAVRASFPDVRVMALGENVGFARANNLAAASAGGRYLLLLNPDTIVLNRAIERLVVFADRDGGQGLYGGRTLFDDRSLNRNSCHGQPTPWSLLCKGVGLSALWRNSSVFDPEGLGSWRRDSIRSVDCITGCFLLVRAEIWKQLQGFDSSFFMYGEDTDLCIRARQKGHPCIIFPDAQIIHRGGRSERVRADKMVRLFRAKRQLMEKHWVGPSVGFGRAMLGCWALSRWRALSVLALLRPEYRSRSQEWKQIWQRRAEFMS